MKVASKKSVTDLDAALCNAEAIQSVIKDDQNSYQFRSINQVIRDLNNVKSSTKDLQTADKLPE